MDNLLRAKDCAEKCGISTRQWWRLVAKGTMPRPVKLGGCACWQPEAVDKAVEDLKRSQRVAGRAVNV